MVNDLPNAAGKPREEETTLWYFERGCIVYTAEYHLRRGACCGNGCRHCPFDGVEGSTEVASDGSQGATEVA